jgi:hypothetical protein
VNRTYGPSAPTSEAFGFNLGDGLQDQQKDETDEQRRRRLSGLPETPGQSPQVRSLFGGLNTSLGASLGGRGRMGI